MERIYTFHLQSIHTTPEIMIKILIPLLMTQIKVNMQVMEIWNGVADIVAVL